jgi:hypothetical protein
LSRLTTDKCCRDRHRKLIRVSATGELSSEDASAENRESRLLPTNRASRFA